MNPARDLSFFGGAGGENGIFRKYSTLPPGGESGIFAEYSTFHQILAESGIFGRDQSGIFEEYSSVFHAPKCTKVEYLRNIPVEYSSNVLEYSRNIPMPKTWSA